MTQMKIVDLTQGSPEWLEHRDKFKNASEAPVIMGASPYKSRDALLREKKTGDRPEHSAHTEALFQRGHDAEAAARPIVEQQIGEELYPVVATRGELGASFDGITLMEDVVWECKLWNEGKAADVRAGKAPEQDYWQLVHQFYVSGAQKIIYTVTDGTADKLESLHIDRTEEVEQDIKRLLAAWNQFDKDLKVYEPQEVKAEVVGRAPEDLPSLRVEITGMVKASNLEQFKAHADSVIKSISRDLVSDQDFADAEKTVRWLADVEKRIDAAKEHALSQTASIDDLFRALDGIKEDYRATRLELDKLVKAEKTNRREEIRRQAQNAFEEGMKTYNDRLGGSITMPPMDCDIAGKMKGRRTIATLEEAAGTEVARALSEAVVIFEGIQENLEVLTAYNEKYAFLLTDKQDLVQKPKADMVTLVEARIAQHESAMKAEAERLAEQERERIRAEEEAKVREAARKEEAERLAKQEAERLKAEEEARARETEKACVSDQQSDGDKPNPAKAQREQKVAHDAGSPARPTAADIVAAIALHSGVSDDTALAWIKETSF